jgi:hypothetical protein
MDKERLKSAGLLERISAMTAKYEDEIADLRVELTIINEERNQLLQIVQGLNPAETTENQEGG